MATFETEDSKKTKPKYSPRDLSSNRLRAIKKAMLQGLQDIDNLYVDATRRRHSKRRSCSSQLDHNEITCIEAEAINGLNRLEIV